MQLFYVNRLSSSTGISISLDRRYTKRAVLRVSAELEAPVPKIPRMFSRIFCTYLCILVAQHVESGELAIDGRWALRGDIPSGVAHLLQATQNNLTTLYNH